MSMSQLARALEAPVDEVVAWETGERFPTKKMVGRLEALLAEHRRPAPAPREAAPRDAGASARMERAPQGASTGADVPAQPWEGLADPEVWLLLRKLAAFPKLRAEALRLAEAYPDPARARDPS